MSAIQNWMESTAFEFLVVGLITSTIVLAITALIARGYSQRSAAFRFVVWRAGILLAVILPLAVCVLPKVPLGWQFPAILPATSPAIEHSNQTLATPGNVAPLKSNNANQIETPAVVEMVPSSILEIEGPPVRSAPLDLQLKYGQAVPAIGFATAVKPAKSVYSMAKELVVVIWLVAATWQLILLLVAVYRTRRWRRRSTESLQVRESHVRQSLDVNVPMTIGVLRPTILLPASTKSWSPDRLRMVIDHEQAHIFRRDVLWTIVSSVARSVFWCQPLYWIAHRHLLLLSEQACDDQVLQRGTTPSDYARELVAIASELTKAGPTVSLAGLSISQPPIETRIKSVLDEFANRQVLSRTTQIATWLMMAILLLGLGTVRPFSLPVLANSNQLTNASFDNGDNLELAQPHQDIANSQKETKRLPEAIFGRVTDADNNPVAGATIRISQLNKAPFQSMGTFTKKKWQTTTDTEGNFRIEIEKEQRSLSDSFSMVSANAEKDGFVRTVLEFNSSRILKTGDIGTHQLLPGRLLTGRLVEPPEIDYGPPKNGVVKFTGLKSPDSPKAWFSFDVVCKPDGTFRTYVPRSGKLYYVAAADNYAPVRDEISAPNDLKAPQPIGDIALKKGSPVFGKLLDETGQPMPGMVVQLGEQYAVFTGLPTNVMTMPVTSSVKTGADGSFQFPPHSGKCYLYLTTVGSTRSKGARGDLVSEQRPPVVTPVELDLNESGVSVNVNLRPAKTIAISGQFKWSDGQPAKGIEVRGMLSAGRVAHPCSTTISDESGMYQLAMPIDNENHLITAWGGRKNGILHYAYPGRNFDAIQKSGQFLILKNDQKDLVDIDWDLVNESSRAKREPVDVESIERGVKVGSLVRPSAPYAPASTPLPQVQSGKPVISIADKALIDISNKFYEQKEEITALARNISGNKQEEEKLEKRNDHLRTDLVSELLKFESKHRGDIAAVNALGQIIEMETPRQLKSQQKDAFEIVREHYIGNPNLWLILDSLESTFPNFPFELIRKIQDEDPYPLNRVYAHYYESDYLANCIFYYRMMERRDWDTGRISPADFQAIRKLNVKESLATINKNLATIKSQYAGILRQTTGIPDNHRFYVRPYNHSWISFIKRRTGSSALYYGDIPFTDLAKLLDFKVNHLVVGKKFPRNHWNDSLEQSVNDRIGKNNILLLVTFSRPSDTWKHMLTRAKLVPNLEIVWLRDNGPWSQPVSTAKGKAGQRPTHEDWMANGTHVIHDDPQESLAFRWGQMNTEAVYFIDKQGIVRAIDQDLSDVIDEIESGKFEE